MREVHIAMCLLEQDGSYLLQHRLGDPKIGAAGLVGCFGGKVEPNESSIHAACRELSEETNLNVHEDDLEELGEVNVVSDHNHEQVSVHAEVFLAIIDSNIAVEAKEGALVSVPTDNWHDSILKMTPATKACFEQLVKEK